MIDHLDLVNPHFTPGNQDMKAPKMQAEMTVIPTPANENRPIELLAAALAGAVVAAAEPAAEPEALPEEEAGADAALAGPTTPPWMVAGATVVGTLLAAEVKRASDSLAFDPWLITPTIPA